MDIHSYGITSAKFEISYNRRQDGGIMEIITEGIVPKKPKLNFESLANAQKEIELPGYEEDILFNDQVEETNDLEFLATENLENQKHLSFEAVTVRLESQLISRINDIRRKTTKNRRERLAGSSKKMERLTNNSFYRAIMDSVIDKLEKVDFSDCASEEHLREKISGVLS